MIIAAWIEIKVMSQDLLRSFLELRIQLLIDPRAGSCTT